ncbi:MAG: spore germination protein [Ectobacillus sp.]
MDKTGITFQDLLSKCKQSNDFLSFQYEKPHSIFISYFKTLVNPDVVHRDILAPIVNQPIEKLEDIKDLIPVEDVQITEDVEQIQYSLLTGYVMLQLEAENPCCALVAATTVETRQVSIPETEFSVVGPKEAFVESLDTNINLVRRRLPIPELYIQEYKIGKLSKTRVAILHIEGIANKENVNTMLQRIRDIEFDIISDISFLTQILSDNHNSPFPQFVDTERPDRVTSVLAEGKVAIIIDGSPHALTGPTTLVEFFSAFEDYFLNWSLASAIRLIRLFSVLFSVLATPLYVAILTFHYEMIPEDLMGALIASRSGIPFPPFWETIILELVIELLREAGARLPSKVGQTIGIVGGIVIGTASVQAGITSNVLLIVVALAALASFTTPVYQMSNSIRLVRFPFLIMAQLYGVLGVTICFAFVMSHLLKLTSLGRPYVAPIYPLRVRDLKDSFIRLPFSQQATRPSQLRTEQPVRFNKPRAKEKRDIED